MIYRFGTFVYDSDERLLVGEHVHLRLAEVPHRLLTTLLESGGGGKVIKKDTLLSTVWSSGSTDDRFVEENNLNSRVRELRRALGDNPRDATYIETIQRVGYSLIPRVEVVPSHASPLLDGRTTAVRVRRERASRQAQEFSLESHKFVPVYVGLRASRRIAKRGTPRSTPWGRYYEVAMDDARLCVFASGVGVWHLREDVRCGSIADLARWRRHTYRLILDGNHPSVSRSRMVEWCGAVDGNDWGRSVIGAPGYVLSFFVLTDHPWSTEAHLRTALRLLSSPSVLQPEEGQSLSHEEARRLEGQFFRTRFDNPDIREFGMPGAGFGFASWAGISYCPATSQRPSLTERVVEFEVSAQALWWLCGAIQRAVLDGAVLPRRGAAVAAAAIREHLMRLQTIGPREPTEHRTMVEAVLSTSRLGSHVAETLSIMSR